MPCVHGVKGARGVTPHLAQETLNIFPQHTSDSLLCLPFTVLCCPRCSGSSRHARVVRAAGQTFAAAHPCDHAHCMANQHVSVLYFEAMLPALSVFSVGMYALDPMHVLTPQLICVAARGTGLPLCAL